MRESILSGRPRWLAVAWLFLKLGAISFGGPAAHIALMEQEAVRKRGWLSREHFLDLLAGLLALLRFKADTFWLVAGGAAAGLIHALLTRGA